MYAYLECESRMLPLHLHFGICFRWLIFAQDPHVKDYLRSLLMFVPYISLGMPQSYYSALKAHLH